MKKYFIITILIICIVFTCSCTKSDDVKTPRFYTGNRTPDDIYGVTLNYTAMQSDNITLAMESGIYTQATATALHERVAQDYAQIAKYLGSKAKDDITVYVLPNTPSDTSFSNGNELFAKLESINSGTYIPTLIGIITGESEPWKCYALQAVIFDEKTEDKKLAKFYSQEENMNVMSLFSAYFETAFSDKRTMDMAKETAFSFGKHIASEYGKDAILSASDTEQYANDWLESIGAKCKYTEKYDVSRYKNAVYSPKYSLVLENDTEILYMNAVEGKLQTAEDVMHMIDMHTKNSAYVSKLIKEKAPDFSDEYEKRKNDKKTIIINGTVTNTDYAQRRAEILPVTLSHDVVSMNIYNENGAKWAHSGLALYLTLDHNMLVLKESRYASFFTEYPMQTASEAAFAKEVAEYYTDKAGVPESAADLDEHVLFEAMAVVSLRDAKWKIIVSGLVSRELDDSGFTLPEAYLMTKYIIDEYGLENMLKYTEGEDFRDVFDASLEDVKADMLKEYKIKKK
ncbi:MAG: hypothetical protein IJO93_02865 [Clostridia bacterium]|nr:hypothetical protein [Clostridia bacterium]